MCEFDSKCRKKPLYEVEVKGMGLGGYTQTIHVCPNHLKTLQNKGQVLSKQRIVYPEDSINN